MRVLDSQTLEFVEFDGDEPLKYAILSHTWYEDRQEVNYQEMLDGTGTHKLGYEKIKKCAELALTQGFQYFWIDTCCIDKSSSSELSEALNSMFFWYLNANICYAYLSDVTVTTFTDNQQAMRDSRWFTRGWTLQELIAPSHLEFFSADWTPLGSKETLQHQLADITNIPVKVLRGQSLEKYSISSKMSWAANRKTKRIEDRAYSLLGIFNVNMPLLYGEKEKAFIRLQEEIMKVSDDQSIFFWHDRSISSQTHFGLLARSPDLFSESRYVKRLPSGLGGGSFQTTNQGILANLFVIPADISEDDLTVSLDCWVGDSVSRTAGIRLIRLSGSHDDWGSHRASQFARFCCNVPLILNNGQRRMGSYRKVYVRQKPKQADLQSYRHSKSRLPHDQITIFIRQPAQTSWMTVEPARFWDPQTGAFECYRLEGTLGQVKFKYIEEVSAVFGRRRISEDKFDFWVSIMKTPSDTFDPFQQYDASEIQDKTDAIDLSGTKFTATWRQILLQGNKFWELDIFVGHKI